MLNLIIFFFLTLFYPASVLNAQKKYAVVVGVNDYYESPGKKHFNSLHGCVNDAMAIESLLKNRFGFSTSDIMLLTNEKATAKNVIDVSHLLLDKCNPGDAFVFYFSGHGVWMTNDFNEDRVKRKMSQAMVMTDLYSPGLQCLFTDEMIKKLFNEFIDKKVLVTALFDCCYSGNLPMAPPPPIWEPFAASQTKNLDANTIRYFPVLTKPVGCSPGSLTEAEAIDNDGDGIPDCRDWEINSPPTVHVDSLGITDVYISAEEISKVSADDIESKSFNLKDALKVGAKPTAPRPSERLNSGFMSFSAATDVQKAAEISDEAELKHGAFTKAFIEIYKTNPSNLPVSVLMKKISAMMEQEKYEQIPSYNYDKSRQNGNLLGIPSTGFSDKVKALCTNVRGGQVTLDKGLLDGIAKGNQFKAVSIPGNPMIEIISVTQDNAIGVDKTGKIKKGDRFEISNLYMKTAPLIKIFIPVVNLNQTGFQRFFEEKIKPLVAKENYADYDARKDFIPQSVRVYYDEKQFVEIFLMDAGPGAGEQVVLMPIPSYLAEKIKTGLAGNQNIEMVNDIDKADCVLYLNFIKKPTQGGPFVFYYHPPIEAPGRYGSLVFTRDNLIVSSVTVTGPPLQKIVQQLVDLTILMARKSSTKWMNLYPRK